MKPQKPKTPIKMAIQKKYKEIYLSHELPDCLQEFRENLVDESAPTEPW